MQISYRLLNAEACVQIQASSFGIFLCTKGIGDRPYPEQFGFPLLLSFYQCSINSSLTEAM